MDSEKTLDYNEFLKNNRITVNKCLNAMLWFFVLAGPAVAAGVRSGIYNDIGYDTCAGISLGVILISAVHRLMVNRIPSAEITCLFVLTALDILLVYMACSHVSIYLTWFLVPLLGLLYCDKMIFYYAVAVNYVLMLITTWVTAPYNTALRTDHRSPAAYFADRMGGFTIETLVMFAGAYTIGKLILRYFRDLFSQYNVICEQEATVKEKMDILSSMAEIYDNVNLLDFVNNTEMSIMDTEHKKHGLDLDSQTHTLMNQRLLNKVMPEHTQAFLEFTNIKTVRERLANKKILSADFIDTFSGWFRAQYISVEASVDGIPNIVIYTTRNVDEEKRREEHLIEISLTDEMTRLFNRRCYDEDLGELKKGGLPDELVLFSVDVNGLKTVNDTKGHAAGDELIKAAADCIAQSVGNRGKVYRTGGDEFMAVVCTPDPEEICTEITNRTKEWRGVYLDEISISVGYASRRKDRDADISELEHLADERMYKEKERYYRERGIERRRS